MTADDALSRLLERLPAHLVARDAAAGGLVRSLLRAVAAELDVLEDDLDDLYDAWFVETCAEWLVPYLADLVGVDELPADLGAGTTRRALVANTVAYRRRKGTVAVLEQVGRDATGWPARAVEYFRLLAVSTHVDHVHTERTAAASVRDAARLDLTALDAAGARALTAGLDPLAHTAEVRRIGAGGRYGIPAVGVFVYPVGAYEVGAREGAADATGTENGWSQARPSGAGFTVDPIGHATPLFAVPAADEGIEHLSGETDLPVPLRPRRLLALLTAARVGELDPTALPLGVRVGATGTALAPDRIRVCGLEDLAPGVPPVEWQVMVDSRSGRLTCYRAGVVGDPGAVFVRYAYGGLADVGAGTHDRSEVHDRLLAGDRYDGRPGVDAQVAVRAGVAASMRDVGSVGDALARATADWAAADGGPPAGGTYVVSIGDSATYPGSLQVVIPPATRLVLVAAGWPDRILRTGEVLAARPGVYVPDGLRPHLQGTLTVTGGPGSSLVVDGVVLEGDLVVEPGDLGALTLGQSTVTGLLTVAGAPDARNGDLQLTVVRSVLGGVVLDAPVPTLAMTDSVVDGVSGGPALVSGEALHAAFDGCTVLGDVSVRSLDASSCVFDGTVTATYRQVGCLRYCCTGPGSRTPRRFRCVPADAAGPPVSAVFASRDPGSPVYPALATTCPAEIRIGGEDCAGMGVHHHVLLPLRLSAAEKLLAPYIPAQLQTAILGS